MLKSRVPYILRYRDEHFDTGSKVLALMFGKKNAQELDDYFTATLTDSDRARVVVKTFHSIAGTLLYKFRGASKVTASNIERIKSHHLIQDYCDYTRRRGMGFTPKQVKGLLWAQEEAQAKDISVDDVIKRNLRFFREKMGMAPDDVLGYVYDFEDWRYKTGKLVFNDYMPLATQLPPRCFKAMNFNDIVVDEVQDLNAPQRGIVKNFMVHAQSVTAVGDRQQAVFGFCGADDKIFEKLKADYPGARSFPMHYNYRSTDQILELVNRVLEFELESTMHIVGTGRQGPPPLLYTDGAAGLLSWLEMRHESGEAWKDIAILYRSKLCDLAELEVSLATSGIPYVLHDGGFFEENVVQDMIAYFNVLYHPKPVYGDWRRIFQHVKGIGDSTAEEVWEATNGKPLNWRSGVPNTVGRIGRETAWREFWENLKAFKTVADSSISELTDDLILMLTPCWDKAFGDASPHYLADRLRLADVFREWVNNFGPAAKGWDVVQAIELIESGNRKNDENTDAVQIMSGHKSKGMQFNSCAVWCVSEGKFPMNQSTSDPGEERRLGYVVLSRAKTHLALICPKPGDRTSTFAKHVPEAQVQLDQLLQLEQAV
jgi:DNA helicase-2/ATP-dependent DNA helicase PcrA